MKCSSCCYLMENHRWLMLYRNRKPHDVNAARPCGRTCAEAAKARRRPAGRASRRRSGSIPEKSFPEL